MTNSPDRSSAESCDAATLADKIAAWSPSSKCPLVFIARERRLIEDALRTFSVAQPAEVPAAYAYERATARTSSGKPALWQNELTFGKPDTHEFIRNVRPLYTARPPAAPVETDDPVSLADRIRKLAAREDALSHDCDMRPEDTANYEFAQWLREAASFIERHNGSSAGNGDDA